MRNSYLVKWFSVNPGKFSIGLLQTTCALDTAANLDRTCEKIREAAKQGAPKQILETGDIASL